MDIKQSITAWNSTKAAYPADKCIHQLFEEQVRQTPDALAVIESWETPGNRTLTYHDLNIRANQFADYLRKNGVEPEVVVGICMERSLEMVIAIMGIIKSGGIYVLLDPDYPAQRLEFMLEDSSAQMLVTQKHLQDKLDLGAIQTICLDPGWEFFADLSKADPKNLTDPDNLIYIIYTSGSTGQPKGAMISHRALCNHMTWMKDTFPMHRSDRILVKSPISFDAFGWEFFTGLLSGAALVLAMPGRTWDVGHLLEVIQKFGITSILIVPSHLRVMLEHPESRSLGQFRYLFVGGEAFPVDLVERINTLLDTEIINLYGPAEASIDTTYYRIPANQLPSRIPIGRPINNTQAYILDNQMQLLPVGESGELYLGGDNLGRGYYRNSALTADRFVPNPFGDLGERLYRTGDLARYLPDGELEYLGRMDFQVKIRGSRVELGEIERLLLLNPAIFDAAVVATSANGAGDGNHDLQLVAYIQLRKNFNLTVQQLRAFLRERLPEYMIPVSFMYLDSMPHSTSGKVDRQVLSKFTVSSLEIKREVIPPRTPVEEGLTEIWSEVLGIKNVGIQDNFFELGGHSLALAQVLARIYERFNIELPIAGVFSVTSIAQMAGLIEERMNVGSGYNLPPIPRARRDVLLPLSYQQEQVWFLLAVNPESLAYNFQITIRLHGKLNHEALEKTLSEIIRRHEIYRTTFTQKEGMPVQIIHAPWTAKISLIDLSDLPEEEKDKYKERLLEEDFAKPFNITQLPLVVWKLFRFSPEEHLLLHLEHHLVHDGWSFAVLMKEFIPIYSAFSSGKTPSLPELEIQFADYAVWQRQNILGDYLASRMEYWKDRLHDAPPLLTLPYDRPRPKQKSYQGESIQIELDGTFYNNAKSFSLREGVTLFSTFLAAFKALLFRYTDQDDLVVGSGFANRLMRQTEPLIGMFVNSVVLRTDLSGEISFRQLLARVSKTIIEASSYQDVPFDKLVEVLQPDRSPGYNPFFQVLFSFHDSPIPELEMPELYGTLEHRQNKSAKFDLNVVVIPRAEQLHQTLSSAGNRQVTIVWEYDTDLFNRETMQRMLNHYLTMLQKCIENPDEKITKIEFISDVERSRIVEEWNATKREYPEDRCVQELFLHWVNNTPEGVAIKITREAQNIDPYSDNISGSMTYQELNERSNQLAHFLRARSIGPNSIVGVCLERGIEVFQAFLAILKAGGAYLPLDVTHPSERIRYMIEDSGTKIIITDEKNLHLLGEVEAKVICLDRDREEILNESVYDLPCVNAPEDLAYVIYTSGSTGRPKGSGIPHRAVNRLVCNNNYLRIKEGDRIAQVTNTSFDLTTFEVWGALLNGGCLVILPLEILLSPSDFAGAVLRERIDVLCIATSLFNHIASSVPGAFQGMRDVIFGGEAAAPDVIRKVLQAGGPKRLLNGYGPTENTTWTTYYPIESCSETTLNIPIGRPVSNTKVYILDRWLQLVPVGVPGEIYNAGDGLARDYLNHPSMTAEKFLPDPFGGPGERMYRTGDKGRYLPDGNIEFLGRIDQQIKLRGFRVELGEIEALLDSHDSIKRSVVVLVDPHSQTKQLVAYLVFQPGHSMDINDLRAYLGDRLPTYMIPNLFVSIPALPLTPNGKLDRKALPPPSALELSPGIEPPESVSALERVLLQIWSEVLDRPVTSLQANFFELGGHSLLGIRLLHQISSIFDVDLSPRLLYVSPTVKELASVILKIKNDEREIDKIAQTLLELKNLSDERVFEMLGDLRSGKAEN